MPIDISDSTFWQEVDYQTLERGSSNFIYQLPIRISSQVIFIYIQVPNRQNTWYTGGWINQFVQSNIINSNVDNLTYYKKINIGANIISFPTSFVNYSFYIVFPNWFTRVAVTVYQFTGLVGDPTEIQVTLNQTSDYVIEIYNIVSQTTRDWTNILYSLGNDNSTVIEIQTLVNEILEILTS
jgi:hypothetical protein